jgi:hypothetical protein
LSGKIIQRQFLFTTRAPCRKVMEVPGGGAIGGECGVPSG